MTVARSRTRSPAQTSSTCSLIRSQPLSLLSMAKLKRARPRDRCFSCSRTRIAQTSFGLSGRFCPVIRPLFQGAFFGRSDVCISLSMIASVQPTTPSQRLPIGGRGNLSERRVSAALPTLDHDIRVRGGRPFSATQPPRWEPLFLRAVDNGHPRPGLPRAVRALYSGCYGRLAERQHQPV